MDDSEEDTGNYLVTINQHADCGAYTYDFQAEAESEEDLQKLKEKIGGQQSPQSGKSPGRSVMDKKLLFISHTESDKELASELVELVLAALELKDDEVRCTSVPGYKLPFGKSISQQLKDDINISAVIIALITEESLRSKWVLFELGASWALGKMFIPILKPGLTENDLPGPLSEYRCIKLNSKDASSDLIDAFERAASELNVSEKTGSKRQAKLEEFIKTLNNNLNSNDVIDGGVETPYR